jgi:hypothetical protein
MSNEEKGKVKREKRKELDEMTLEEKLALLSETDKAYVCDFIDRALQKRKEKSEEGRRKSE